MQRRQFLSHVLSQALAGTAVCSFSGCGTLMHAERRRQPHSNDIDWGIAALDGLGLLLFFVPGIAAFAVDFYTGAIYLPMEQSYPGYGTNPQAPVETIQREALPPPPTNSGAASGASPVPGQPPHAPAAPALGLKRVVLPREQLQSEPRCLEQVVADHVGQRISLDDSQIRLSELAGIDQFDEQLTRHRSDRSFGHNVRSFFSKLRQA